MADNTTKRLDDIMSPDELIQLEDEWRANVKRQFMPLKQREWLRTRPPERRMLLEYAGLKNAAGEYIREPQDVLSQGIVAMLAATGGVGKTQALIQLALAVASGTPWLDQLEVCAPGHVALVLAEESEEEVWRRLWRSVRRLGLKKHIETLEERIWPLVLRGTNCRFIDPMTGELSGVFVNFREALLEAGVDWRLIILDPASRLMPIDAELDNQAATDFIALLEALTRLGNTKPTVLVAHHTRKHGTGKTGVRGASALTDGVRWLATLNPYGLNADGSIDPDGRGRVRFEIHKSNYSEAALAVKAAFDANGILHELTPTQRAREAEPQPKRSKATNSQLTSAAFEMN